MIQFFMSDGVDVVECNAQVVGGRRGGELRRHGEGVIEGCEY